MGLRQARRGLLATSPPFPALQPREMAALDAYKPNHTSLFTRRILHWGVDAVAIATTAGMALRLLDDGITPTSNPDFKRLFDSGPYALGIRLDSIRSLGVYVPAAALHLDAEAGFVYHPTSPRVVRVVNEDFQNLLVADPGAKGRKIPSAALDLGWTIRDFDDAARATALLLIARGLWEGSVRVFTRDSGDGFAQAERGIKGGTPKLLDCYRRYVESLFYDSNGGAVPTEAGIKYIEKTAQSARRGKTLSAAARSFQLAQLNLKGSPDRDAAVSKLRELAATSGPLARLAQSALSLDANPVKPPAFASSPPLTGIPRRPARPLTSRATRDSSDEAAPTIAAEGPDAVRRQHSLKIQEANLAAESGDGQTRKRAFDDLLALEKVVSPELRDAVSTAIEYAIEVDAGLEQVESISNSALEALDRGVESEFREWEQKLQDDFTKSPAPVAQEAKNQLRYVRDLAADGFTPIVEVVVTPEGPGDTSNFRAALREAFVNGYRVRLSVEDGRTFEGMAAFGDLDLSAVTVFSLREEWSYGIQIPSIASLTVLKKQSSQ